MPKANSRNNSLGAGGHQFLKAAEVLLAPHHDQKVAGLDRRAPGQEDPGVQIYARVEPGTSPEAARSRAEAAVDGQCDPREEV